MAKIKFDSTIKAQQFLNSLNELMYKAPNYYKAVLTELAGEAAALIKTKIAPRDTGNLRSTVRVKIGTNSVSVIAGGIDGKGRGGSKFVNYASYVNYGTSRQRPQFFMERGVAAAIKDTKSIAHKSTRNFLKELK